MLSKTQGLELQMDVPTLERAPLLLLEVSTPQQRGLNCTWTCLDNSSLCCSWTCLHYGCLCCTRTCLHTVPELHLDLYALLSPVLHLDGFPLQGPELHGTCLHNSSLHVLLLDLSTHIHYRDLCCTRTCLHTGACASPGRVYTTESCALPGRVSSKGP